MTEKDEKKEPQITVTAEPVASTGGPQQAGPPIPPGHSRYYCSKCHAPYDLPDHATSWRCANCSTFNSITPGECEWCSIL
mmetsp:Transcript_12006/g.28330  ORF Transcript_12006/g.28330 Transcript_12006/m.28330 type:complete len:80 (-) Transcript_12006:1194-1433(-)